MVLSFSFFVFFSSSSFVYLPRLWVVLAFTRFERKREIRDVEVSLDRDRVLGLEAPGLL